MGALPTIVDVFFNRVRDLASRPALRHRGSDGWQSISWNDYGQSVREVGAGLLALGIEAGDRVAILSGNRPEWLFADMAILSTGAVSVPVYPTSIAAQTGHVLAHSQASLIVVDSAAQRDKVRSLRSRCKALRYLVVMDAEAGEGELTFFDLRERGRAKLAEDADAFERARAQVTADTLATIVYTSGTTGPPKGAMLSHKNLAFEADQVARHGDFPPGEETLSFLPLSHVAERLQGELIAVALGFVVNFGRGIETVREDLLEVRPTILTCVPRLWEKIYEGILGKLKDASPARRALFGWAIAAGKKRFYADVNKRRLGPVAFVQARLADRLVGKKIRTALGLDRARFLISGAAPLSPEIQAFFGALGMPILEAYGQTECTGVSHGTTPVRGIRPGTVGNALDGIEVRIAEDGEILVRGDSVFVGYYKDEAATQAAVVDGWLHTGDVGEIDSDGYLKITDRKKDIIVTAGGKNVAPQNIENRLKSWQGISQVVVLGDKRKHLVALVTIDEAGMEAAVGRAPVHPPSKDAAVCAQVQAAIDAVNSELSSYETIKRFAVLDNDFSIESGELTPSLKVKRRVVDERYQHVIASLYAGSEVAAR